MIRLKDVAARAGVSLMTVSKVLRDAPDVSEATKAKVRRLAEEMGYVPDALAQGLRTRRTRLLALVIPTFTHPVLGQAAAAIQQRAADLGYDLLLGQSEESTSREEASLRRMLARRVDGLFLYPVYRLAPTAAIYDELQRVGTPTVLLGPRAPFCKSFLSVEAGDAAASQQLTQHLIQLGHRQIAFFAGPPAAPWAQERFEGYRQALREAGIPFEDRRVFTAGTSLEDGRRTALQMLNEETPATAVQTATDPLAVGAALGFGQAGLKIPDDLSLAGYGDYSGVEHFQTGLTTVRQPKFSLGLAAMDSMVRLLRREVPDPKKLAAELVIRGTTAPVHESRRPLPSTAVSTITVP